MIQNTTRDVVVDGIDVTITRRYEDWIVTRPDYPEDRFKMRVEADKDGKFSCWSRNSWVVRKFNNPEKAVMHALLFIAHNTNKVSPKPKTHQKALDDAVKNTPQQITSSKFERFSHAVWWRWL